MIAYARDDIVLKLFIVSGRLEYLQNCRRSEQSSDLSGLQCVGMS